MRRRFGTGGLSRPHGIVDIGSNSVRLVILADDGRSPEQILNEKVVCALGRGLAKSRLLNGEGMARTLETLKRFRVLAEHYDVARLDAFATAAVRDADNGDDFLAEASSALGTEICKVSGLEEACLAAEGVLSGLPDADGLVGDMGGGSLELAHVRQGRVLQSASLKIGALRLADQFGEDGAASRAHVLDAIRGIDWIRDCKGGTFYAVGGIWRNFARVHIVEDGHPLTVLHAYTMGDSQVRGLARSIIKTKEAPPKAREALPERRLENILHGAAALDAIIDGAKLSRVAISAYGVREGWAFSRLKDEVRAQDPLFVAATRIADRMARTVIERSELDDWLGTLFQMSADPGGRGAAYWARLRHAAGLFADIGWRFNPDSRALDTTTMVLTTGLPGIDHVGRAYVALALWNRYTGNEVFGLLDEAAGLLDRIDPARRCEAKQLGRCLRLAFTLTGGAPGLLSHCRLSRPDGKTLVLSLSGPAKTLASDEVARRLRKLAESFDAEPSIAIG